VSRSCSISIDVDPLPCYYRIHALGAPPPELRARILVRSLPRFAELFADRGIAATFFVVAEDVDAGALGVAAEEMRAVLAEAKELGHEIANHSYRHPYDLARWPLDRVREEIGRAHELLSELVGEPVRGFRAPGYDLSGPMLQVLLEQGYHYDSSLFPAPGYYAAKAAVMAALRVVGRKSGAVLTNPRALLAPADPYRPSPERPWRRGGADIVELPIAVTPKSRTPAIGTNLLLAPRWLRSHWIRSMSARDFFNFELHGIDLCDADEDQMPAALVARQPDLRVPLTKKRAALGELIDEIAGHGFEFERLDRYVDRLSEPRSRR
jgi:hypothetical protein